MYTRTQYAGEPTDPARTHKADTPLKAFSTWHDDQVLAAHPAYLQLASLGVLPTAASRQAASSTPGQEVNIVAPTAQCTTSVEVLQLSWWPATHTAAHVAGRGPRAIY